jgi:hypothetical protein
LYLLIDAKNTWIDGTELSRLIGFEPDFKSSRRASAHILPPLPLQACVILTLSSPPLHGARCLAYQPFWFRFLLGAAIILPMSHSLPLSSSSLASHVTNASSTALPHLLPVGRHRGRLALIVILLRRRARQRALLPGSSPLAPRCAAPLRPFVPPHPHPHPAHPRSPSSTDTHGQGRETSACSGSVSSEYRYAHGRSVSPALVGRVGSTSPSTYNFWISWKSHSPSCQHIV